MATVRKTAEIGRVKNIAMLPFERMRDLRKAGSIIGPRTKENIRGATSYLNSLRRYPRIPKMIITIMSEILLFRLYAPIMQKRRINVKRKHCGILRTFTQRGINGRFRIRRNTFPTYILAITPQKT